MSGRRLVDAARLAAATRSVAEKHVGVRSKQIDIYSKTSTIAKAAKNQTDRVTLTARAALNIRRRLNEVNAYKDAQQTVGQYATKAAGEPDSIPRRDIGVNQSGSTTEREGLQQDHHWNRSEQNASISPQPEGSIQPTQVKPERYPLPDGTIPPEGSPFRPGETEAESFYERPGPEAAKKPLSNEDVDSSHDAGLRPTASGQSTIPHPTDNLSKPSPERAMRLQRESEAHIPRVVTDTDFAEDAPETFNKRSHHVTDPLSSLPRQKIPKHPEQAEGIREHIRQKPINAEVYYSPEEATSESQDAQEAEDDTPEGVNINVFRTSRGGDMLNQKKTSSDPTATGNSTAEEMRTFAQDLAEDAEGSSDTTAVGNMPSSTSLIGSADPLTEVGSQEAGIGQPRAEKVPYQMRESRVPSSRFGRLWEYSGLATSMAFGAVGEGFRRVTGSDSAGSLMLSSANLERLVAKLSRMRGAALKLGQMLSFQDLKMLPAPIHEVLQRVQDSADYMPTRQRDQVLVNSLGNDWRDLFSTFDDVPLAAASIGQVHRAVMRSSGQEVAVKVQYPGVASSIDSDLNNLSLLLTASRLLPKGLFLDKTIANARTELAWECDYVREAQCAQRFHSLLADETDTFTVPAVITEASGKQVLTTELMSGTAVTKLPQLTQPQRDWIGTQILRLCFREITEFRFMQTDPNWTNFLYDPATEKLQLLDFGASRDFPTRFIDPYVRTLAAAAHGDRDQVAALSVHLGYLTGHESRAMRAAHVDSVLTLAEPFAAHAPDLYDFRDQTVTDRVREQIPLMLRERLAPPPEETYSLHRKLSGAFLLCARLGSRIRCREMFDDAIRKFEERAKREGGQEAV